MAPNPNDNSPIGPAYPWRTGFPVHASVNPATQHLLTVSRTLGRRSSSNSNPKYQPSQLKAVAWESILTEHYAESAKKELIKSRIKEKGQYTLIGQLAVRLDQSKDHYWANVPALGDDTVRISANVLAAYTDLLLTSGAWGTMEIEYDATYEIKSRKYPFYIREFTPLDEWIDLLIQSIGFNPVRFDRRTKMLFLLRMVPFVEANYNLIELGPRCFQIGLGKRKPPRIRYNICTAYAREQTWCSRG